MGPTIPEAAEQCGVSISSVVRFLKLHRETGSVESAKFGGYKDFTPATHEDLVRQFPHRGPPSIRHVARHARRVPSCDLTFTPNMNTKY
jgi:hypothetical protein